VPVVAWFCVCHGYRKGTRRDHRAHRPYARNYVTTATYEARMRVGSRWLDRQQAARALRRR